MIKQISLEEALKLFLSGKDVRVMAPWEDDATDWKDGYYHIYMSEMFKGVMFFDDDKPEPVEEIAKEEPEEQPEPEEPAEENPENAETIPAEATPEKPKKEKKVVDHDRIMLLIANGKKPQEVAEEVGCHVSSVYNVINRYK